MFLSMKCFPCYLDTWLPCADHVTGRTLLFLLTPGSAAVSLPPGWKACCSLPCLTVGLHMDAFKVKSWQITWPSIMPCQQGFSSCCLTWQWVVQAGCHLFQVERVVFVFTCICGLILFPTWPGSPVCLDAPSGYKRNAIGGGLWESSVGLLSVLRLIQLPSSTLSTISHLAGLWVEGPPVVWDPVCAGAGQTWPQYWDLMALVPAAQLR